MRVQPRWQVDVCQQNVCRRGRNGAEHHIPNQEFVSYRIHANKKIQTFLSADLTSIHGVNQWFSPSKFLNGI